MKKNFIYHVAARFDVQTFDGILHREKPILDYNDVNEVKGLIHRELRLLPETPVNHISITSLTYLHTAEVMEESDGKGGDQKAGEEGGPVAVDNGGVEQPGKPVNKRVRGKGKQ